MMNLFFFKAKAYKLHIILLFLAYCILIICLFHVCKA